MISRMMCRCVEIFCGNLPWSIDEDKMTSFFKGCGTVTNTRWLNDKETGDFKVPP